MTIAEAISLDPEIMSGELCFSGTRVPVESLFGYLEGGTSLDEFFFDFPDVSRDQVEAVIRASFEELDRLLEADLHAGRRVRP